MSKPLPVLAAAGGAYTLLWRHRLLHAKAIWPPVVFLVTAEFLYHRVIGNAHGLAAHWQAALQAPWYMPAAAAAAWLAGLKFLLSFSISWRRHLLLGERFDPFFFHAPFWRYLGFLLLTYAWLLPVALLAMVPTALLAAAHQPHAAMLASFAVGLPVALAVAWAIARQVPFFTALALGPPHPGWRACVHAMRGAAFAYLAAFILAMLPLMATDQLLDHALDWIGADRHAAPVALSVAAFRQAVLFIHFSLGASIGALTTRTVLALPGRLHAAENP